MDVTSLFFPTMNIELNFQVTSYGVNNSLRQALRDRRVILCGNLIVSFSYTSAKHRLLVIRNILIQTHTSAVSRPALFLEKNAQTLHSGVWT